MQVNRAELIKSLKFASIGMDMNGGLEQSDTFVFVGGNLFTFNDEILTRSPSPFGEEIEAAVMGKDLLNLLERLPDETLEMSVNKEELLIKGKMKTAGVTCFKTIELPYKEVPSFGKWFTITEEFRDLLGQAAAVGSQDASSDELINVHVTKNRLESCDNNRVFRADIPTGFPKDVLLPVKSCLSIAGLGLKKGSVVAGWCYFAVGGKRYLAIRCSTESYRKLDDVLVMKGAGKIVFPDNLSEIIRRAESFSGNETNFEIKIEEGVLSLTSRKDTGWYRERKKIKYNGETLQFSIQPKFLIQILERSHSIEVIPFRRMKIQAGPIQFVSALPTKE